MAELPPVEDIDDALAAERETIRALKRAPPGETVEQARMRSCKLIEAQSRRIAASRRTVADAVTPKQTNGSNGAQPVSDSDELLDAVARGTARFVKATVKPLKERLAKLEQRPRLEGAGTFKAEWVCKDNTDDNRSCDECGVYGKYMRAGPVLLNSTWLAICKRREEFLCVVCTQARCVERLGRELSVDDLRGCDANRAWLAALKARNNG